jgi:hypothetical protein
MANDALSALQERFQAIQSQYSFSFAFKPRASRNPDLLSDLLAQTTALIGEARRVAGSADLLEQLESQRAVYESEREKVLAAQAQGPAAIEAAILASRANMAFFLYRGFFAGQSRSTRDIRLLEDIVGFLDGLLEQYEGLVRGYPGVVGTSDRDVIRNNLTMYRQEMEEIRKAQKEGDLNAIASNAATIANSQFELYRTHFAGRPRISRRPALLHRIVASLEDVRGVMTAARRDGLREEFNEKNIEIVEGRLATYRDERVAVDAEMRDATAEQRVDGLATAANTEMGLYRDGFAGQNRATRDLVALRDIVYRLFEIERQMSDLTRITDNTTNLRNLGIVQDTILTYMREYEEIEKAKGAQG